jgi:hypothetical protein
MPKVWIAALAAVGLLGAVQLVQAATLTLRDGSTISGEVLSLRDGVYTVRSATLGTVTVKQADVRTLSEESVVAPAPGQVDALQARLAADPGTVQAITALSEDPDVQAILNDPDLLAALQKGNLDALLSSPKIARLAADPRVQDITRKFSSGSAAPAGEPSH